MTLPTNDQPPALLPEEINFFEPLVKSAQTLFSTAYSPQGQRKLLAAVRARMSKLQLSSLAEYASLMRHEQGEWSHLWPQTLGADGAFFRPVAQFEVAREVLSEWSPMAPDRHLRVLSLGCGPGYETVSLAIALEEAGLRSKNWQIDLMGLDLNPEAVAKAEAVVFSATDLEWLTDSQRRRWFTPRVGGFHFKTTMAPPLRLVTANAFDLETWPTPDQTDQPEEFIFDLIFCRGLTYEAPPLSLNRLTRLLRQILAPTGFIFTAPGEFLPGNLGDLQLEERNGVVYYRRGTVKIKVNRHHQTRKQLAGKSQVGPSNPTPTSSPLPPLTQREEQLLEQARGELAAGRPEEARPLVNEVMLTALDRNRATPEAWAIIAQMEEALGRPDSAAATAEMARKWLSIDI